VHREAKVERSVGSATHATMTGCHAVRNTFDCLDGSELK